MLDQNNKQSYMTNEILLNCLDIRGMYNYYVPIVRYISIHPGMGRICRNSKGANCGMETAYIYYMQSKPKISN